MSEQVKTIGIPCTIEMTDGLKYMMKILEDLSV